MYFVGPAQKNNTQEREQLLQEMRDLKEEAEDVRKDRKVNVKQKVKETECQGEEVRRKAMEGMSSSSKSQIQTVKFQ